MALKDFRFENLPQSTQLLIVGVLAVGMCGVIYFLYLQPMTDERNNLQNEVSQLERETAQAAAIEARLKKFRSEVAELESRLAEARTVLPAQKETPVVLRSVQEMATASNLKITKFTPQPVVPRDFYADWPILIEVNGSFNALGLFFEKISKSERIINVENLSVKAVAGSTDPSHTLTAVCTATTFVFREEQVGAPGN